MSSKLRSQFLQTFGRVRNKVSDWRKSEPRGSNIYDYGCKAILMDVIILRDASVGGGC